MSKLDEIQARTNVATKGPWIVPPYSSPLRDEVTAPSDSGLSVAVCEVRSPAPNAVFIAHAREDVPTLVAALRAVEAVHVNRFHDKYGRTKETPQGNVGGWCNCCGNFYSDYCPTISAIREALT